MAKRFSGFDWDTGNIGKCQKHGVTLEEIEFALRTQTFVAPDFKHSFHEQRFIAIERNEAGRLMFVAFTLRERNGHVFVRPVSARYMHKKEIMRYEKKSSRDDD